jgi:hypothetical protein
MSSLNPAFAEQEELKDRDRQSLRERLMAGAASPHGSVADRAYFDGLRARITDSTPKVDRPVDLSTPGSMR